MEGDVALQCGKQRLSEWRNRIGKVGLGVIR